MIPPLTPQEPEVEPYLFLQEETPLSIAKSCRAAGLSFVNGATHGWGKRELGRWLLGPYRTAACDLPGAERDDVLAGWAEPVFTLRLQELLREVTEHVLSGLRMSPDGLVKLPAWALTAGSVMRSRHAGGVHGFVPIDWPRMRLEDRVMSLFAVDCLLRREDYETTLAICGRCSMVSFDASARRVGACVVHARSSLKNAG
jgi:hypothetical protein